MDEIEVPTEHLHETIHEQCENNRDSWSLQIALSTAIMAVIAAITGLLSEHHSNEALIDEIRAADQWAYYQAKGVKAEINSSTNELLITQGHRATEERLQKIERYKKEQEEIKLKAEELEKDAEQSLAKHEVLARGITFFQIAIALGAVAILTRKRFLWAIGLGLGLAGIIFLVLGLL